MGLIPDTAHNRVLCEPQFEFVTPQQLVAIDFFLSMLAGAPALAIWHDVNVLGRRYAVPSIKPKAKPDIALHGWYPVGQYDKVTTQRSCWRPSIAMQSNQRGFG